MAFAYTYFSGAPFSGTLQNTPKTPSKSPSKMAFAYTYFLGTPENTPETTQCYYERFWGVFDQTPNP